MPSRTRGLVTLRTRLQQLLPIYGAAALALAFVALVSALQDRPFAFYAREPSIAVESQPGGCSYLTCASAGLLSNIGVLILVSAAVVASAAAWLLRGIPERSAERSTLLIAAALTWLLALDDMLLIHDYVATDLIGTRSGQLLMYAAYGGLGVVLLRRLAAAPADAMVFALAGALLAASAALDLVADAAYVVEDSVKLFGLCTWAAGIVWLSAAAAAHTEPDRGLV